MTAPLLLLRVARDGIAPEVTRPDPGLVVAGDPEHTTWNIEEVDGLWCGLWQSTPGQWRVSYAEWEYVHILKGVTVLHGDDGSTVTLKAGDGWIIRPGYAGVWEVVETTLKEYVIRA
ncbi:MAG: cupin domain-containing protein [Gemmobacter sp.]